RGGRPHGRRGQRPPYGKTPDHFFFPKPDRPGGRPMPSEAEIQAAQKQLGAGGGLPGLGGGGMGLPPGLSGFGKKK
ncbi:MAG: hypothetical protein AAFR44_14300, partial [Pseudomonadota bacterium]